MNFIQNTWFVGITTGIISSILVFFLTKWIMDKSGKTEYYKQVANANHNVINSLKPYIADQGLPSTDIFNAIISSTARELGVDEKDMYSIDIYCEELIREIISDVYVSNEKKREYMNSLSEYKKKLFESGVVVFNEKKEGTTRIYSIEMIQKTSLLLSLIFGISTILSIALFYDPEIIIKKAGQAEPINISLGIKDSFLFLISIIIISSIFTILFMNLTKRLKKKIHKFKKYR